MTRAGHKLESLLTVPQAAEILAVSRRTIYCLVSDHKLECVKVGGSTRFEAEALRRYVERHRTRTLAVSQKEAK